MKTYQLLFPHGLGVRPFRREWDCIGLTPNSFSRRVAARLSNSAISSAFRRRSPSTRCGVVPHDRAGIHPQLQEFGQRCKSVDHRPRLGTRESHRRMFERAPSADTWRRIGRLRGDGSSSQQFQSGTNVSGADILPPPTPRIIGQRETVRPENDMVTDGHVLNCNRFRSPSQKIRAKPRKKNRDFAVSRCAARSVPAWPRSGARLRADSD